MPRVQEEEDPQSGSRRSVSCFTGARDGTGLRAGFRRKFAIGTAAGASSSAATMSRDGSGHSIGSASRGSAGRGNAGRSSGVSTIAVAALVSASSAPQQDRAKAPAQDRAKAPAGQGPPAGDLSRQQSSAGGARLPLFLYGSE